MATTTELSRFSTLSSVELSSIEDVDPLKLIPITTLGRGSYGKVVLARTDSFGEDDDNLVAVKIVAKARLKSRGQVEKARTEMKVMKTIAPTCPFLVSAKAAFQTEDCLLYVMPYCPGGELFFHLQREGRFSDARTKLIAMQIVLGLEHLHAHGVVYRDLKPENVVISDEGRCQLIDFGLSKFLPRIGLPDSSKYRPTDNDSTVKSARKQALLSKLFHFGKRKSHDYAVERPPTSDEIVWGTTRTRCGTPAYQPVEIVQAKEHSLEADWWSLGVLVYELLVGEPPFFANTVKEVYEIILANNPRYPNRVSEKAKGLISRLLVSDRTKRLGYGAWGARDVKKNPYFSELPTQEPDTDQYPSWDQVARLAVPPVIQLSESGVIGKSKDAIYFHADYTSIDVREYLIPPKNALDIEGFQVVPQSYFKAFLSDVPVPIVEKGCQEATKYEGPVKAG